MRYLPRMAVITAVVTAIAVLFLTGCSNPSDPKPSDPKPKVPESGDISVTFTNLTADGSTTDTTTKLTLTFDKDITGLSAADIVLDAGSTGAVKGTLYRTGIGIYDLVIGGITTGGSVTVAVSKSGYDITGGPKTVTVYHYVSPTDIAATFTSLTADGSATVTTTKLTLTFDQDITDLSAADIVLDAGSTGATIGSVTRTGTGVYDLTIVVTAGGSVTVVVSKSGYNITGWNTVTVYHYIAPTDITVAFINLTADGYALTADGSATVVTTKLTLTFDKDIYDLSREDIVLDAGSTGAYIPGNCRKTETGVYEFAIVGIATSGSVTVAVSKPGYNITGGPKTVFIFRGTQPVLINVTADGSATATTTKLTLTFNKDVGWVNFDGELYTTLESNDISIADVNGPSITKGTVTRIGTGTYELPISGITIGCNVTVKPWSSSITGEPKTVFIHYYSVDFDEINVPGGSFQMGDVKDEWDSENGRGTFLLDEGRMVDNTEKPVHTVTLTGFYMGKYEVTQGLYYSVMGTNPSSRKWGIYPVNQVSWYDAIVFCNKLSIAKGLSPAYSIAGNTNPAAWGNVPSDGDYEEKWDKVMIVSGSNGYRLPTEAQWEYAAKGGNGSPENYTYAGSNTADDVVSPSWTLNVGGSKLPNGLGLYDMSGNVAEWCWDRPNLYPSTAQTDPTGATGKIPTGGAGTPVFYDWRIIRGGGYQQDYYHKRSACREWAYPSTRYNYSGFRVVRP
jgi:formylglycine-generating enzyme required for sulfatase activity